MFLFVLAIWVAFGIWGYNIGKKKQCGSTAGFWWGFLLGIFGILILSFKPDVDAINLGKAEELMRWSQLRESGAITEEEFQRKKSELM